MSDISPVNYSNCPWLLVIRTHHRALMDSVGHCQLSCNKHQFSSTLQGYLLWLPCLKSSIKRPNYPPTTPVPFPSIKPSFSFAVLPHAITWQSLTYILSVVSMPNQDKCSRIISFFSPCRSLASGVLYTFGWLGRFITTNRSSRPRLPTNPLMGKCQTSSAPLVISSQVRLYGPTFQVGPSNLHLLSLPLLNTLYSSSPIQDTLFDTESAIKAVSFSACFSQCLAL